MAPIVLDPDADTTIYVIQKDGQELVNRVELRVLTAALERNSYWKKFIQHMSTTIGFRPNNEHIEDTGISTTAVEIVLRALHYDYHLKLKESEVSDSDGEGSHDGATAKDKQRSDDTAAGPGEGPAATLQYEEEQKERDCPAELGEENMSRTPDSGQTTPPAQPVELKSHFPKALFEISVDDVWGVLPLINFKTCGVDHKGKLDVDRSLLLPWFLRWRQTNFPMRKIDTLNTQHDFECVLFPTFAFNDAVGWSHVTEWLCKNTSRGQIGEYSPLVYHNDVANEWYRHLHLPKGVIAHIRIARSQLYARMERKVWDLIYDWFSEKATCDCRVVAAYNYRRALQRAEAVAKKLLKGKSDEEDRFRYSDRFDQSKTVLELRECLNEVAYEEPHNPCIHCTAVRVKARLSDAMYVATDFEGLCLDCMEASLKPIPDVCTRLRYIAYSEKVLPRKDTCRTKLCSHCRRPHGYATWYFSWVNTIPRQSVFPNVTADQPDPFADYY